MLNSLLIPLLIFPSVTSYSWIATLANGSTSCVTDALCKAAPNYADGFDCTQGIQNPNSCDVLGALYVRWSAEAKVLSHILKEVSDILEAAQLIRNTTSQLLTDLQTLRGRQAVSGAVQVSQVLMFLAYILTIFIAYMVKYCQEARARHQTQEFELIEARLMESKSKRRAAASKAKNTSPHQ